MDMIAAFRTANVSRACGIIKKKKKKLSIHERHIMYEMNFNKSEQNNGSASSHIT